MDESIICQKCGTSNNIKGKFCSNCGEKLLTTLDDTSELIEKGTQVYNSVSSTVSKVESTLNTVSKIGSATDQISKLIVRPPAEWKVVVGEMIPAAGQVIAETAIQTAGQKIQEKVIEEVSKKMDNSGDLSEQISGSTGPVVQEYKVTITPDKPEEVGLYCERCHVPVTSGSKFCNNCGAAVKSPLSDPAISSSPKKALICPSCQAKLTEGAKFCKKCGTKFLPDTNNQTQSVSGILHCPSCGNKLSAKAKFCKKCGRKIG